MSNRIVRYAVAPGIFGVILALATATAVRADDSDDDDPAHLPNAESPAPLSRIAPASADPDNLVRFEPNGEHDKRVGAILAAHPDRDVLICLAGCGVGGPKIVALRHPAAKATEPAGGETPSAELRTSSGRLTVKPAAMTPTAVKPDLTAEPAVGDVICLAGCTGEPGEIVQEAVRLTWINNGASEDLRLALRGLAERLFAEDAKAAVDAARGGAEGRHAWMSDEARRELVAPTLPPVLASLVKSATALVGRSLLPPL